MAFVVECSHIVKEATQLKFASLFMAQTGPCWFEELCPHLLQCFEEVQGLKLNLLLKAVTIVLKELYVTLHFCFVRFLSPSCPSSVSTSRSSSDLNFKSLNSNSAAFNLSNGDRKSVV